MRCSISRYALQNLTQSLQKEETGIGVKRPLLTKQIAQSLFNYGTIYHLILRGKEEEAKKKEQL